MNTQLVPLSRAIEVNPKIDRTALHDDLDVSFVPMAAVEALSGGIDVSTVRKYAEVKKGYTHFRDGDILFAKVTPCMENGKMAIARKLVNGVGFGSTEFHVLRPRAGVDARYIYYFVSSQTFRKDASGHMTGAVGLRRVPSAYIEEQLIPLPGIEQQCAIVAELEKQFSRLDEAVANLQRVKANLKRYRASVLKDAVEGRLVETDGGWRQSTLGEEGAIIGGLTKNQKRNDLPLKLPYLRVANVYANELRLDEIEYIGVAEKELKKLLVCKGDLLVVEGNGSSDQIGRVALWNDAIPNCVHQNHLIKVRFGDAVMPEWALIWMLSPIGRHEIEQVSASTSGLYTLSVGKVSRLPIDVPWRREQARIVAEVERRLSLVRGVEAEVDTNLKRAQALRQATLAKAFSIHGDYMVLYPCRPLLKTK